MGNGRLVSAGRAPKAGLLLLGLMLIGGTCGCQCAPLTNHYANAVDHIAGHEEPLDALYHPGLDLTRIGRSDWCQCGINRTLCRCACERRKPLPHFIETSAASYVGAHLQSDNAPHETCAESREACAGSRVKSPVDPEGSPPWTLDPQHSTP